MRAEDLVGSRVFVSLRVEGRPGGIQSFPSCVKEELVGSRVLFPFGCEGRPSGVSRVLLFPSGVKEDQLSWVL
ncbi:hypothetical protein Taro_048150 [Colocasia esculenta]|uniref:Uncharacterized protein n=1 Tax=Colocasia esculenta TaxID=4460 RepID=A0A843X2B3_COLES|nr:hypothetical protein [Colocasia esculenta]